MSTMPIVYLTHKIMETGATTYVITATVLAMLIIRIKIMTPHDLVLKRVKCTTTNLLIFMLNGPLSMDVERVIVI